MRLTEPATLRYTSPPVASNPGLKMWGVLGLAVLSQAIGSIVSQGVYTLVPFFREAFGLSLAGAASVVTVMNGGQILSMFPLGRLIDRHGERTVVGVTMIGMGIMAIVGGKLATSFLSLQVSLLLLGMFYASVQPGGTRAILRWFPPQRRGLATGFRQAAVPLGTAIAAVTLPGLSITYGWRTALVAGGILGIVGGILFWAFYDEGMPLDSKKTPAIPLRKLLSIVGQDPAFWPVLSAGVAMNAFQFTFTAHAISFMSDRMRMGLTGAASLFAAVQVIGIFGRVLVPLFVDHIWPGRREQCLGWVMAICVVTTLVFAWLPVETPPWLLYTIIVSIGIFGIGWYPLYILQIAEIAPGTAIAATVSFAKSSCMVAMSLCPFVFGVIVDYFGFTVAWIVLVIPMAVLVPRLVRLPVRRV